MRVVWAGEALARVLLHASLAGLLHSRYRHQGLLVSCGLLSRNVGIRGMDVHNDSSGLLLFAVAYISIYACIVLGPTQIKSLLFAVAYAA